LTKAVQETMLPETLYYQSPYGLRHEEKEKLMFKALCALTKHHRDHCQAYSHILKALGTSDWQSTSDIPFIPVRLFKEFELLSIDRSEIFKVMTSSGTSGQTVSRIFLDRDNVRSQTQVLSAIVTSFIGKQRLPLLMLDTEMVKKDRSMYSARGAGIIGFSTFGKKITYALDTGMELDVERVKAYAEEHANETVLMFGYTYMIWTHVVKKLEDMGIRIPFKEVILFHIGGWKKLQEQAVGTQDFNRRVNDVLGGHVRVHNYYGMVEQLGSVFVECEYGHMHCSNFSDVHIRKPEDFSEMPFGEKGLIEVVSLLPTSYPGHALLTEDEGEILGEDDCPCGRYGKYFRIYGRIKGAELRGCSDTYGKR